MCLAILVAARTAAAQSAPHRPLTFGRMVVSGYVELDYLDDLGDASRTEGGEGESGGGEAADSGSSFTVQRARASLTGALGGRVNWTLMVDFAALPDASILRDAAVTVRLAPQASVRLGQYTIPYSLERLTSTLRLEVIDRTVLGTSLVPSRDLGVTIFNPTPIRGWLSYSASVTSGTGANRRDNNGSRDVVGRVTMRVPRATGLAIGVNAETGEQPAGDRRRGGIDVSFEHGPLRFAAEALAQTVDGATRRDTAGYYVLGAWHHPAATPTPWFAGYELAARWVDVDDDADTLTTRGLQFGGNYYVTPRLRIMNHLIVPVGDHQSRPAARWWSRLQVAF